MSSKQYKLLSPHKVSPILSLNKFAHCLGIPRAKLEDLVNHLEYCYEPFEKKTGDKKRVIDNPQGLLKEVQKRINDRILSSIELPGYVVGGVKGKKPTEHPQRHINKSVVVTMDVKDCFPSITNKMIFDIWHKQLECSSEVARLATKLTTRVGHLPLGASTSLALSNLALRSCLGRINIIAQSCGFIIGQYVDDLAFSGDTLPDDFITAVVTEFQKHGFRINRKKIVVMRSNEPQIVTKKLVNKKVSIPLKERNKVRASIDALERIHIRDRNYVKLYRSVKGRIGNLEEFHPDLASKMIERFNMLPEPAK
jgi:hypothetical protein